MPAQGALAEVSGGARAETDSWTAQVVPGGVARPAGRLTLTLRAQVQDGWHVYALKQLPDGPTPLVVALEPNKVATANGTPVGSPPSKIHDPAFGLDTEFYSRAFTVSLPLRVAAQPAAGRQQIPVRVRFQTCNGQICQPPKTVHLTASLAVAAR
jgi:DsbC/DsbD-like thiol-disulfide interchange protein